MTGALSPAQKIDSVAMKQTHDIEKLLQWAINDELPKGQHVQNAVWRTILRCDQSRLSRTFTGWRQAYDKISGGFVLGEPHPDAIAIGGAINALNHSQGLGTERDARIILGPLVNVESHQDNKPPCITAALAVRPNVAALIVNCAILKRRPFLDPHVPKPMCIKRTNGRPTVLREDQDGDLIEAFVKNWRNEFVGEPRCPLLWGDPSIEEVAEQRAEYTIWWHSLSKLAQSLADKLTVIPTQPSASPSPWLSAPAREPTLWRGAA